jgi:hypothetical protein
VVTIVVQETSISTKSATTVVTEAATVTSVSTYLPGSLPLNLFS